MKIAHTADWHLGKKMHNIDLLDDQQTVLDCFIQDMERERPDVILITGDLFDRSMPGEDAVRLLSQTLTRLVDDLKIPVIAIAGNHDSQARIDYAAKILKNTGLYIIGDFSLQLEPINMEDRHGRVQFFPVPFVEPSLVRLLFQDDAIKTHEDVMRNITAKIRDSWDPAARHVFVGHAFVTPSGESAEAEANSVEAERPLIVGGAEYVSSAHFVDFNYAAFGHLHREHAVGKEHIRYSGSLLKYSFSEESHTKGWLMVELDGAGQATIDFKPLPATHDVRTVRGKLAELERDEICYDYVLIKLQDEIPVINPMGRIRGAYPNAMQIQRELPERKSESANNEVIASERTGLSPAQLFRLFYQNRKSQEVSDEMMELFLQIWQDSNEEKGEQA